MSKPSANRLGSRPRCSTRTSLSPQTTRAPCSFPSWSLRANRFSKLDRRSTSPGGFMPRTEDILSTLRMVKQENLDVRTITMGINLSGCSDRDLGRLCDEIYKRITSAAENLAATCSTVSARYGIPIVNRRLSVTPIGRIGHGHGVEGMLAIARTLEAAA